MYEKIKKRIAVDASSEDDIVARAVKSPLKSIVRKLK